MNKTAQEKLDKVSYTLALVATEAVLAKVDLVRLSPLLLCRTATAVAASAARHLLVGLGHSRPAEATLVLSERLTAWAWACPRISQAAPISKLPLVPLT
jgi:hypothetical protein